MADISGPFDLETGPAYAVDFEYREASGRCGHTRVMELDGWVQKCDECHDPAYDEKELRGVPNYLARFDDLDSGDREA